MSTAFRIVMVGPLPPDRSGIAEYSAGLVATLRTGGLLVDTVSRKDFEGQGPAAVLETLRAADAVVYQMGNHPFHHGWMLPFMAQVPGIVHLHDLVLHHMAAGVLHESDRLLGDDYPAMLDKWHLRSEILSATSALRRGAPIWDTYQVVDFPLHQIATKLSTAVVVHSDYAAQQISRVFPWIPVTVVPQLYTRVASYRARKQLRTIVLLGGGQVNRRFDWVVQALARIDAHLQREIVLEVAGDVVPEVQSQLDQLTQLGSVRLVNHGHASDEKFWELFEHADLMIALRQPTMGETSAVVSKALQAGLPTIVSDHGWYAELPSCVRKISPDGDCPQVLSKVLESLLCDDEAFERWAEECADYSGRQELDPFAAAERYARLLRDHVVFSQFRDHVAATVVSLKVDPESPLCSELQRIDVRASLRGDRWTSRAILAMAGQELDSRANVVGDWVGAYPYCAPLPDNGFKGCAIVKDVMDLTVAPSSTISVELELCNEGEHPWLSPLEHGVRPYGIYLGHFWFAGDSKVPLAEQCRTWIDGVVDQSSPVVQTAIVTAPNEPGEYYLEFDLVQESVCWFKNKGFTPARIRVNVEALAS